MATCKECLHFEPCWEYGNILDPIHGGMICDSFKPAADVVKVVRCKDCEHYDKGGCKHFGYHTYTPDVDEDDFCSYGMTN